MRPKALIFHFCLVLLLPMQRAESSFSTGFINLDQFTRRVELLGERGNLNEQNCVTELQSIYSDLRDTSGTVYDLDEFESAGPLAIVRLFHSRVRIQDQIYDMYQRRLLTEACIDALRQFDLAVRFLSDYLAEMSNDGGSDTPTLTGRAPSLLVGQTVPFLDRRDLRTGDVLVTRGEAYTSAGIAAIGTFDSQWSHNALVYRDPRTQQLYTIESYIEKGVIIQPIEKLLDNEKHPVVRVMVMRHRDSDLAARAGSEAYHRVKTGPKIRYDYDFDSDDSDRLTCSEVIRWAFGDLIGQDQDIPFNVSEVRFDQNPRFFQAMGIRAPSTFLPGDLLYDPRFSVVAAWRRVPSMKRLRMRDLIMERMYHWLEDLQYQVKPSAGAHLTAGVALTVRRTPFLGYLLRNQVSSEMRARLIRITLALVKVGEAIELPLMVASQQFENLMGRPMTPVEMIDWIEKFRLDDLRSYRNKKKESAFHRWLHPAS
jgi:hypothetical protein